MGNLKKNMAIKKIKKLIEKLAKIENNEIEKGKWYRFKFDFKNDKKGYKVGLVSLEKE